MQTKKWGIGAATGDGAACPLSGSQALTRLELKDGDLRDYTHGQIMLTAGTARVFGSIDGTNYPLRPLVLSLEPAVDAADAVTEAQGTFVATVTSVSTATARIHHFFGTYKALKILQKGATGAVGALLMTEK